MGSGAALGGGAVASEVSSFSVALDQVAELGAVFGVIAERPEIVVGLGVGEVGKAVLERAL